jgi:hypothetical protein
VVSWEWKRKGKAKAKQGAKLPTWKDKATVVLDDEAGEGGEVGLASRTLDGEGAGAESTPLSREKC